MSSITEKFTVEIATGTEDINKLLQMHDLDTRDDDDEDLIFAAVTNNVDLFLMGLHKNVTTELHFIHPVSDEGWTLQEQKQTTLSGYREFAEDVEIEDIGDGLSLVTLS